MSFSVVTNEPLAVDVVIDDEALSVELADGRSISAPLAWYPRLLHASADERANWRRIGDGRGLHWPVLDEDISVANLLAGQPSMENQASLKIWLASRTKARRSTKRRGA